MNGHKFAMRATGTIVYLSAIIVLCIATDTCRRQAAPQKLDQGTKSYLKTVKPLPPAETATKDAHAAELLFAHSQLNQKIAGGIDATDERELRPILEQRSRQLANATQEMQNGKIVGGKPAANIAGNFFSYEVALVYTGYPDIPSGQFCGGTLVGSQWVLTAAHCVKTLEARDVEVWVGSYKLSGGGRLVELAENGIIKHEGYNNSDTRPLNDVALLKLATEVNDLKILPLADENKENEVRTITTNAIISGWGDTSEGSGNGSDDLLYANVNVQPLDTCKQVYHDQITDQMICAIKPKMDTCQGDSGGGLVILDRNRAPFVEGIVSWGIGCARPGVPGIYVRVPKYVTWIQQHMS